ncbi:MAG TPA: HDIG domain-containing protein [Bacillota bacterium]|nr:HDIG domain-containing protein [Bacillota bacterium]
MAKIKRFFELLLRLRWFTIILPMIALGVFIFILTIKNVYTETYDIEKFAQAKETIRSPVTVENKQETNRKVREAISSVEDQYSIDEEISEERLAYVDELFDALSKVDEESKDGRSAVDEDSENNEEESSKTLLTDRDKVLRLDELLSDDISNNISNSTFISLIHLTEKEREEGQLLLRKSIEDAFEAGIRTSNLQKAQSDVKQTIEFSQLDDSIQRAISPLVDFIIVENSFFDPEKTSQVEKEAANNVEPVIIRAGDIIVREGQTITNELYEELKLVGLLDAERNYYPIIGSIILIFLIVSVIGYEMHHLDKNHLLDRRMTTSILVISIIVIALMKIVSLFYTQESFIYYAVPIATGSLLLKLLINERISLVLAALYALIGSIIFNGEIPGTLNIETGIYFLFSQLAAIIFLANIRDRLTIVRAGIGMVFINVLLIILFAFLSFETYDLFELLIQGSFGVASALLSAVLTIGLLPFFETALGILSDARLLTLGNPNHPLLRKLLTEAPGTYHHSIMVANLSETACEAIGANGLLARVGAYYHDVGKTVQPHYFIENQISIKNPHDNLEPKESADIIIAHPYDGAKMLKDHKLPSEIIDITKQHHGTTLLKYFFHKEKEQNSLASEIDFRYPGPKPQTKEAAVICICDSVEAAVRSLKEPTEEKIDDIVSSIINERLMDGQFNESPITLRELETVHETICRTLKGIFHSRIQYPEEEES